ncbi:MAG TPA: DNA-binding domain-containing protein [Polyangia bacterium]|nr:DNA-binding domain-containing protein [Polyangia bacterium]
MRPETRRAPPSQAEVQSALMALITGPGAPAPDLEALIIGDARAGADERLGIYRFMYRARVAEALESQFPHLATHMGRERFTELAAAYIADEPSTHASLRFLGERLPGWLEARRSGAPLLGALARLEWARTDVFDQADEPALPLDAARAWPPESFGELPLKLVSAHRVVTVPAGTGALWDATRSEPVVGPLGEPAAPDRASGAVETLLVWRQETMVYHRTVEPFEREALELAAAGTRFGLVCDALLTLLDEPAALARASGMLTTWLADGLVRAPVDAGPW